MTTDLRYAVRSLLHARWFTVGAVVTFALGIGINIAVFSAVDRMLFRKLPYGTADRLYLLRESNIPGGTFNGTLPTAWVVESRRRVKGIADLAVESLFVSPFSASPEPGGEPLLFSMATYNLLSVTDVRPVMGRGFLEEDARQKRSVVLLSFEAWQRRFGSRADIFQTAVWQGRQRFEIVGILPPGFIPPGSLLMARWDGIALDDEIDLAVADPGDRSAPPIVLLAPGQSPDRIESEVNALVAGLGGERRSVAKLTPLRDEMFRMYRPYLWLVVAAAALVLGMACANLASLLLVRSRSREQQVAIRVALGASRARLVGVALVEALILSTGGAVAGLFVLLWSQTALGAVLPPVFSNYSVPLSDMRVVVLSLLLATITAVVSGIGPALRCSKVDVLPVLQRTAPRSGRLRGAASLLFVEASLGVMLVACAAMAGRSLVGLFNADLGFEPRDLRPVTITFPFDVQQEEAVRFQRNIDALAVLRTMPGVQHAGGANITPLSRARSELFGKGYERQGQRWMVTGGFFESMGMQMIAGRPISDQDVASQAPVAVLSLRGLRLIWPDVEPIEAIGRRLTFEGEPAKQVVGVVSDVRGAYAAEPDPSIYVPTSPARFRSLMFVARTVPGAVIDRGALRDRIRREVAEPVTVAIGDQTAALWNGTRDERFRATLFGTFGLLGLVLAGVGLYAVVSCEVAMRRVEFAIRSSLGATAYDLKWGMVRRALRPVVLGTGAGLIAAYWGAQFLQDFVHRVDARDPWTLVAVAAFLLATATLAAWLPARRAARTDPAVVLRAQ